MKQRRSGRHYASAPSKTPRLQHVPFSPSQGCHYPSLTAVCHRLHVYQYTTVTSEGAGSAAIKLMVLSADSGCVRGARSRGQTREARWRKSKDAMGGARTSGSDSMSLTSWFRSAVTSSRTAVIVDVPMREPKNPDPPGPLTLLISEWLSDKTVI